MAARLPCSFVGGIVCSSLIIQRKVKGVDAARLAYLIQEEAPFWRCERACAKKRYSKLICVFNSDPDDEAYYMTFQEKSTSPNSRLQLIVQISHLSGQYSL